MLVHQIVLLAQPLMFVRFLKRGTAGTRQQKKPKKDGKYSFCFNGYYKTRIKLHCRRKTREEKLLGFIPWKRVTSARGYAQAVDGTWEMYLNDEEGGLLAEMTLKTQSIL